MPKRMVQWAGIAAIAFVVLTLISVFSTGEPPAADDAVGEIRDYLADHRTALLVANFLGLVATPLVLWFGVALREVLRATEGRTRSGPRHWQACSSLPRWQWSAAPSGRQRSTS